MNMLEELQEYYKDSGISSEDFRCKHQNHCKSLAVKFTKAKAALIGRGYQSHKLPRLLFVSLDPGSGDWLARRRTVLGVRGWYEDTDPFGCAKQAHWYRTHELAWTILKGFSPNMSFKSVKGYFAHTNSAKCCANKPHQLKADSKVFANCREHLGREVEILKPDIVVSQGDEAYDSIKNNFTRLKTGDWISTHKWKPSKYWEIAIISVDNRPVLWIHTFHPRCWGSFNNITRKRFGDYQEIAIEFITNVG